MIGTVQQSRNLLHRLGDAWDAFKAAPTLGQLYPPQPSSQGGFLTFPGWDYLDKHSTNQDEERVRTAVQSTSVFANMQAIAHEFASAEFIVKERVGDTLEDAENHPLEVLWEAPNEELGRSYIMEYWAWSYTLASKAYLYWIVVDGQPKEVWPIPPFMIRPVPSKDDFIGGYMFRSHPQATPIMIPRELITYSHSVNLFDIRDGMSFLVAALTPVQSELAMSKWNLNFFGEHNGIPDGLIRVDRDTTDPELSRIRMELRDFFGGTRRGVAVARAGQLEYEPFGRSQKDAEFVEGIQLAQKQIDRTMGFPEGYWSVMANRANAEQARDTMIAGAVRPLHVRLMEDLNAGAVRRWYGDQYRAEFKDIRPEDRQLKLRELESRKSHWTVDELRESDGKDPIGDVRGSMLIAEISKGTPIPASAPSQETEEFLAAQEAEAAPAEEEAVVPVEEEAVVPVEEGGNPAMPTTKAVDLDRWERKALKSLKRFHTAAVRFESDVIPLGEQARIVDALKEAATVDAVKAAFKDEDTDVLIDGELEKALAWAKKVSEGAD